MALSPEDAAYIVDQFGIDVERPLLTQVSRFDPWKDPLGVIDAYRLVKAEHPEVQLALVGSMAHDDPEGWDYYNRTVTYADGDPDVLRFAELQLDAGRHGTRVGDTFVELTRTEYQLLELLLLNPRRVLPHSLIYDRVWGYDFGPASNGLRVYVGYLRRKLEEAGARPLIHTIRGVGYVLREP